jgi:hypothetical protein
MTGIADRGGIGFGDNKHPDSMVARTTVGKRSVRCPSICRHHVATATTAIL